MSKKIKAKMDWVLNLLESAKNAKSSPKPDRVLNLLEAAKIAESSTEAITEPATKPTEKQRTNTVIEPAPEAKTTAKIAPEPAPYQDKTKKPVGQVQKPRRRCCRRQRHQKLKIENSSDAEATIKKQTKKMKSQEEPKSIAPEAKKPVQNAGKSQVEHQKGHNAEKRRG